MNDQMVLLPDASDDDDQSSWELDEHTRQVGRHGLSAAREALQQARARLAA